MTATRTALETYLDINIVLALVVAFWFALRWGLSQSKWRTAFALQQSLLKTLLVLVALSPLLAVGASALLRGFVPDRSLVLSDLAVSAFLRGDIAMEAIDFEAVLTSRNRLTQDLLAMASPATQILAVIAVAGLLLCLARLVTTALCIRRMLAGSHSLRRTSAVDIRVSETITIPFATHTGFRRYIVLPSDLVARPSALRIAVAHELQHLRQRDLEWEVGFEVLRPLFFWNPAFGLLKQQFDRLRELSCDQAVLATRRFDRRDYAKCLLDFCRRSRDDRQTSALNVGLVRSGRRRAKRELTMRVLALNTPPQHLGRNTAVLLVAVSILFCGISVTAASIRPTDDWSLDRLMLSTVVNLERLEAINRR